ncbi:MAG: hypothetical protein QFB87_01175 [Patescibacteria group bacterium]|nr:hypothetical protein [Patescibacteria group bacterium]
MATTLPTTTGTGTQNSTQDPQTAGTSAGSGAPISQVQPGAVNTLDTGTGGVPLTSQNLSTVALKPTSSLVVKPDVAQQHTSASTTVAASLLFVVALVLVVSIFMPAKNTTN